MPSRRPGSLVVERLIVADDTALYRLDARGLQRGHPAREYRRANVRLGC